MDRSASTRHPRRFRPALMGLEPREMPVTAVSSLMVTPAILAPPNNRFVRVTVSGNVIDSKARLTPTARFQIVDEYARIQPGGRVVLTKQTPTVYEFRFTVVLQASRAQSDNSGRQYNVIVGSQDAENANGLAVSVLVPHGRVTPARAANTISVSRWHKRHAHR